MVLKVWAPTWLGIPWVANLAAFCGLYRSNYTLWSLPHVSHLLLSRYSYLYLWTFPIIPRTLWIYQNWARSRHLTDSRIRPRCNHHHQSSESSFVFSSEKKGCWVAPFSLWGRGLHARQHTKYKRRKYEYSTLRRAKNKIMAAFKFLLILRTEIQSLTFVNLLKYSQ